MMAAHQQVGYHDGWVECSTCMQVYTGAMQLGMAKAINEQLTHRAEEDEHRLCAQDFLAEALSASGLNREGEAIATYVRP